MRTARIVEAGAGYYHVISRVVGREHVFEEKTERERFRLTLRAVEGFSGTKVLSWAVLSNHFHILLYVPERQEIADRELGRRMRCLYPGEKVEAFLAELGKLRECGQHETAERMKAPYTKRMYNLADFVKTLKQRVSISYNRRHNRVGTLWEERFKSVLVEGDGEALRAVAAYIDLNPVRAGLVSDPKDYRYSGYGEAMGGSKLARAGLAQVVSGGGDWEAVSGEYRKLLYIKGEARGLTEEGKAVRPGFSEEQVDGVLAGQGKLALPEALRMRVRYFTDGLVLGRKVFVEDAFGRHRGHFSEKRRDGARVMKGAEWGGLFTARALRLKVMGAAASWAPA